MNADEMIKEHHHLLAMSYDIEQKYEGRRMRQADFRAWKEIRYRIFELRGRMNQAGVEWREPQTEWSVNNYGMLIL